MAVTIKQLTEQLAAANLTIATLRVELAETTTRSANNAHFAGLWKQKYYTLLKSTERSGTAANSDYAAKKAAAIAEALRTGESVLVK